MDATAEAGVAFTHHAARTKAHLYPETFGAGAALLDLDGDGDLDLLLLDTGSPPGAAVTVSPSHGLYRNDTQPGGAWRFTAVTAPTLPGLAAMGACVGDVDGDGDPDVHVTGLPAGRLLVNEAGTLRLAGVGRGATDPGWSTACAFLDADLDGDLDLFSGHYVQWAASDERTCGGEVPGFASYCPPDRYPGEAPRLFVGDGRGAFRDVSAAVPALASAGKTLGLVVADLDQDGRADIYLANDQVPNTLLLARPGGTFVEAALVAGVALSEEGRAQAGMGVDAGDVNGDLALDLFVVNLDLEAKNLYVALGARRGVPRFRDQATPSGLGGPSLMALGFGAVLADLDLDGDLDAFVANGHVIPEIALVRKDQTHAMEDQLFESVGTRGGLAFRDARERWMPAAADRRVSRGLAVGDLDGDGDLDLVVTTNDGAPRLLRNETASRRWLGLRLEATVSAPGAPGASVRLEAADGTPTALAVRRTGSSYLSASDERLVFGLGPGPAGSARHAVQVTWPNGKSERFTALSEGRYQTLTEGHATPP